jgi:hypothetical protein
MAEHDDDEDAAMAEHADDELPVQPGGAVHVRMEAGAPAGLGTPDRMGRRRIRRRRGGTQGC